MSSNRMHGAYAIDQLYEDAPQKWEVSDDHALALASCHPRLILVFYILAYVFEQITIWTKFKS